MTGERLSVFLSLILRHKPEVVGLTLDRQGYLDVEELIEGIKNTGRVIDKEILNNIVREDTKKRYKYSEDKKKIRASQGHSVKVDLELQEQTPPGVLYHGTAGKFIDSINKQGISKQAREYVHLSEEKETALSVGKRHGKVVILEVDTKKMINDGYKFYMSENGVWLTDSIPRMYFVVIADKGKTYK